jgi:hypothetical protein
MRLRERLMKVACLCWLQAMFAGVRKVKEVSKLGSMVMSMGGSMII